MTTDSDGQGELRGKLLKRLAMAGVLVAVLLGVLAFFDYLSTPEEPEPTVYEQPVPVPPKKEVTQPVKPATDLPEPPEPAPPEVPEKAAEAPPPPAVAEAPPPPAPAPAPGAAPETSPPARIVPARPAPPKPPALPDDTAPPSPAVPEETAAPSRPPAPAIEAPPPRPAVSRLMSGYILQAGVFNNAQRAEELHAKLTLNGIPSTLEARVQVGPFKTRAEADAAREKLKALGIDAVLMPPAKGPRR